MSFQIDFPPIEFKARDLVSAVLVLYWLFFARQYLTDTHVLVRATLMYFLVAASALHWGLKGGLAAVGWFCLIHFLHGVNQPALTGLDPGGAAAACAMAVMVGLSVRCSYEKNQRLKEFEEEIQREYAKAKRIHQGILPHKLPDLSGYDLYALYQPAAVLGGDIYMVTKREGGLIFGLSDVTGHGLDSALLSIYVKTTFDSYMSLPGAGKGEPRRIVDHLAERFRDRSYPNHLFVCLLFGFIDLKKHELRYCSAGLHIPPLLVSPEGELREIPTGNLPVSNVVPECEIAKKEERIAVRPGTVLFFATDGIAEQERNGRKYMPRLKQVLQHNHTLPSAAITDVVMKDFAAFNGGLDADDDITFLVIKREKA